MLEINEEDLDQAKDEIEYLKTELYGHLMATNRFGFKAEKPVFTASADGKYFC